MIESGCRFYKKDNLLFIEIDTNQEYEPVKQFLKATEGILIDRNIYFIEVKRYDYFRKEEIDENLNKIIEKVVDSYFFLIFLDTEQEDIKKISNILRKKDKIILVIYICPSFNKSLEKDRKLLPKEIIKRKLKKKLKNFRISFLIDTEKNYLKLFKSIEVLDE